jgi:hypothetical protein
MKKFGEIEASGISTQPIPLQKLIFATYAEEGSRDGLLSIGLSVNPAYATQFTDADIAHILDKVKTVLSGYVQRTVT